MIPIILTEMGSSARNKENLYPQEQVVRVVASAMNHCFPLCCEMDFYTPRLEGPATSTVFVDGCGDQPSRVLPSFFKHDILCQTGPLWGYSTLFYLGTDIQGNCLLCISLFEYGIECKLGISLASMFCFAFYNNTYEPEKQLSGFGIHGHFLD